MKRLFLLAILVCGIEHACADNDVNILKSLLKYNQLLSDTPKQLQFLRQFEGDTITLGFTTSKRIVLFVKEKTDTIWLTKKPKKNPKEGKDFELDSIYMGIKDEIGYHTPASAINEKHFILADTEEEEDKLGKYRDLHKGFVMQLIDPENRNSIKCTLPQSFQYELFISSSRIQREINSLIGKKFYIQTSEKYASTKTYEPISLRSGTFLIQITNKGVGSILRSRINLVFEDQHGTLVKYKPEYFFGQEVILSEDEHAAHKARLAPQHINSIVDKTRLNPEIELPFKFRHITGTTRNHAAIFQQIDPTKYYPTPSTHLMSGETIGIGDRIDVKGEKYYKAFYNGKAFFIKTSNVILAQDQLRCLDTLMRCPTQEREVFYHRSLNLFKQIRQDELANALATLQSYKKYGLNIETWGVYDESEYTDGTGIRFRFLNPTNQTIKYITINFTGYNAVDDPVPSRGKMLQTRKCIGPIEPDATATYEFEYVWFTDIVEYAKIRSIVVEYKNGTTKTITNTRQIVLPEELTEFLHNSNPVKDLD